MKRITTCLVVVEGFLNSQYYFVFTKTQNEW